MMTRTFALVLCAFSAVIGFVGGCLDGYYDAGADQGALYVIDGDTIRIGEESIRIMGLDAPETRFARCDDERRRGNEAKARLLELLSVDERIGVVRSGRVDRYGRTLARVYVGGEDVAGIMIGEGHARAYDGGRREGWC